METTQQATQESRTQRFGRYIATAAREAGYDIDGPRGGGKVELARDTGMSPSSVGRMLAGKTMPDPIHLASLAKALGLSLIELLYRSGVVPRDAFPALAAEESADAQPVTRISPAEAARQWGIRSPDRVAILESVVRTLIEKEQQEEERDRSRGAG